MHSNLSFTAIAFILSAAILSSCRNGDIRNISEGEIHYSITSTGSESTMSFDLMPRNLVVSFKRDRTLFSIKAPIGSSGITNLSVPEKNVFDTYVNILGIRYYYAGKPGETPPGMQMMENMEVISTGKTEEILGLLCHHAEVTLPMVPDTTFHIWYTRELDLNSANVATPFHQVDGVLISFFLYMGDNLFLFNAENIYSKDIPERTFRRRERYREIPRDEMESLIISIMNL